MAPTASAAVQQSEIIEVAAGWTNESTEGAELGDSVRTTQIRLWREVSEGESGRTAADHVVFVQTTYLVIEDQFGSLNLKPISGVIAGFTSDAAIAYPEGTFTIVGPHNLGFALDGSFAAESCTYPDTWPYWPPVCESAGTLHLTGSFMRSSPWRFPDPVKCYSPEGIEGLCQNWLSNGTMDLAVDGLAVDDAATNDGFSAFSWVTRIVTPGAI
jgi:hypothetical protein